jgi:ubiquinone/menaquinone biosynthesis C-methylase UbiE
VTPGHGGSALSSNPGSEEMSRGYQEYLVPAMFAPLADRVAEMVEAGPGDRVLDVACGTGALSRALAHRVGRSGRVVALDHTAAMLEVAASQPAPGGVEIEFVQGSAEQLPFADGEFSLVTCQQGLQFIPDRVTALAEFRRVLGPAGRAGIACWSDLAASAGFSALAEGLAEQIGPEAGRMMAAPFALSDPAELRSLLEQAGFSAVVVEIERIAASFADAGNFVQRALAAGPIMTIFRSASASQRQGVVDHVAAVLGPLRDDDTVTFEMPSLVAVARC